MPDENEERLDVRGQRLEEREKQPRAEKYALNSIPYTLSPKLYPLNSIL